MVAKNDITGDDIKTKGSSKLYEDNFERIFGKKNILAGKAEALENAKALRVASDKTTAYKFVECPEHDTCFCEKPCGVVGGRLNVVGQNGNNGEHYESK